MNPREELKKALNAQKALLDKAKAENRLITAEEKVIFDDLQKKIDDCKAMIEAEEAFNKTQKDFIEDPMNKDFSKVEVKPSNKIPKPFNSLAEQLRCIKNHAITGSADERLLLVQNAMGATAGSGADGGFAIQADFAGNMFESAMKDDPILSLVDTYQVSANADRVKWNELVEKDISTSVWGGIIAYWAAEAATVGATKPQIDEKELKLEKLMGFYYNTLEHEQDSAFNSQVVSRGFTAAIRRALAAAIICGDGIGKPLGILKSAGLVSVPKETNQKADTIVWENLSKMYHRTQGDKSNFVWLIHPDAHEQLDFLSFPVGTGGVPVYLPATQVGAIASLRGRPIVESDLCSALGDKGDISFIDPTQYLLIYKGGIDQAMSIHVQFLTAENCFRFIFRVNGMPKKNYALTIKNSAKARSSFITLDERA